MPTGHGTSPILSMIAGDIELYIYVFIYLFPAGQN